MKDKKSTKDNKSTEEFYITKFALTSTGVFKIYGEVKGSNEEAYLRTEQGLFFKRDYYKNKEEVIERCNIMKENKIKALKKQLQKLENLDFNKIISEL